MEIEIGCSVKNLDIKSLRILLGISHSKLPLSFFEEKLGPSDYGYSYGSLRPDSGEEPQYRKSTFWALVEESDDVYDIYTLINRLLSRIEKIQNELASLNEISYPEFLVWYIPNEHTVEKWFGLSFSRKQLKLLSSINASIDIDA